MGFLLLFAVLGLCAARCPQNCGGQGTCVNNHCQCYDGFAGVDCSIVDTALVPGVTQSGSVALRKWRYFHFDLLSAGQEATFRMHETNTGFNHDCDLYVQVNEYPTQRSYYAKDTSWGVNAVVRVNATAPRGTWFVGIFGFLGCTFEMNVTVPQSACPNGCSGNGTCSDGTCQCNSGFGGVDCSSVNRTLALDGSAATGHVQRRTWHYYFVDLVETHERVVITLSSPHDSDLYVRKNEFPTLFRFDQVNASTPPSGQPDVATVLLESPDLTRWYIGVYGWDETDYTLSATSSVFGGGVCANNCSLSSHGSCSDGVCQCVPGFHGDVCEFMDADLDIGQVVAGFVDAGQWNYFSVSTSSSQLLNVTAVMNTSITAVGDCDLYLKAGSYPNRTSYDSADLGFTSPMHVTASSPGDQRFYIGVFGWRACAFSISAALQDVSQNCGAHGHANEAQECTCDDGYFGDECDVHPDTLTSGAAAVMGTVSSGSWTYYLLHATATSFTVTVEETQGTGGLVEVYAQVEGLPSDTDYWHRDNSRNKMHFVHVELASSNLTSVLIGVRSSGFAPEHGSTQFKIAAFAAF